MIKKEKIHMKMMKKILNMALKVEANTTSCAYIYQPKQPKELIKFKKER